MNTKEYLAKAKIALSVESDYALAQKLRVSKQSISNYQSGKTQMDDDIARRVGEIVGVHPGLVILDIHRERARTPQEKSIWSEIYEGFRPLLPHVKRVRKLVLPPVAAV